MDVMYDIPGAPSGQGVPSGQNAQSAGGAPSEQDERDGINARLIDNMIRGEEPSEADEPYAVSIAMVFVESAGVGRARLSRRARITGDKNKRTALIDVVMRRSYSGEDLRTSLARVAKAVAVVGFNVVTAFTATCAYNIFPELENRSLNTCQKIRRK